MRRLLTVVGLLTGFLLFGGLPTALANDGTASSTLVAANGRSANCANPLGL